MTPEIEELSRQRSVLRTQMDELDRAIRAAQVQHLNDVHPLKVGDLVRFKFGRGHRTGRVVKHASGYGDRVQDATVFVRTIRKDGSEGEVKELRSYDKPEKVETSAA